MSMTAERSSAEPIRHVRERIAGYLMSTINHVRRRMVERKNRRILESLPDETLRDIGLSRSDIHAVAARIDDFRRGFDDLSVRRDL